MTREEQHAYLVANGWALVDGLREHWHDPRSTGNRECTPNAYDQQRARDAHTAEELERQAERLVGLADHFKQNKHLGHVYQDEADHLRARAAELRAPTTTNGADGRERE